MEDEKQNKSDNEFDSFLNDLITQNEADELKIGDKIDHLRIKNNPPTFFAAQIIDKDDNKLKIHYIGYADSYDEWSNYKNELYRYSKYESITNHKYVSILHHSYNVYFGDHIDFHTFQHCLKIIKEKIAPYFSNKQPKTNYTNYIHTLNKKLLQNFINIKLKSRVDNIQQYVNEFNLMYSAITNSMVADIDKYQLETADIVDEDKIPAINDNIENKKIMEEITLKWETINEYKSDETNDCVEDSSLCIHIKRIEYILQLFGQYFIRKHKEYHVEDNYNDNSNINDIEDMVDFISLLNEYILNDNYQFIDIINDFNHVHFYHINEIKNSQLFKPCLNKICITNKRNNYYSDGQIQNKNYFGYKSIRDRNIIELFVKYHIFFQHKISYMSFPRISKKFITEIVTDKDKDKVKVKVNKMPQFEFGEIFYYAKHFETQKEKRDNFIKNAIYKNLKEELLNNKIYSISIDIFDTFLRDARNKCSSYRGKKMKSQNRGISNKYYEIPVNCIISISQMLSLIVYTNLTSLQYNFKKMACRKQHETDSIKQIAKWNAQIGHWYSFFKNAIFFFGQQTTSKDKFFHGLSCKLLFARFNPIFKCPISTTTEFTVAMQFSACTGGIILELKSQISAKNWFLNVEWISCYPNECERLFAFAEDIYISDIRFNAIKHFPTNTKHINAFRLLDCILHSNSSYHKSIIQNKYQKLLIRYIDDYIDYSNNITMIDNVYMYLLKHKYISLCKFIVTEQYDSDVIIDDILNRNNSLILKQMNDKIDLNHFIKHINYYKTPIYLRHLFFEMINNLKQKQINEKNIFLIKSQFKTKLNNTLRNKIIAFDDNDNIISNPLNLPINNIKFINEYKWEMKTEEFLKFKQLKTSEKLKGPQYEYVLGNDELIIFQPDIARSETALPDKCGVGIKIIQMPNNITSIDISWSFLFLNNGFYVNERTRSFKKNGYNGTYASYNNIFQQLHDLTIVFFVRIQKH